MPERVRFRREWWPWAVLLGALAVYYWQVLLGGKLVDASDLVFARYAPWIAMPPLHYVPSNTALQDSVVSLAPAMTFVRDSLWHGQLPLWNPFTEFGMPFFAQSQWGVLSPVHLPYMLPPGLVSVWTAQTLVGVLKIAIAGSGAFLLGRRLELSRAACVFAAIAFSFGGYTTAWLGMPATATTVFLPWMCLGVEWTLTGARPLLGACGLAALIACAVLGGHPEVLVYACEGALVYALVRFAMEWRRLRSERLRRAGALALAVALALGLSAVLLLPALELYNRSIDSSEHAFSLFSGGSVGSGIGVLRHTIDTAGSPIHGRSTLGVGYSIAIAPWYAGIATVVLALAGLFARDRRAIPFAALLAFVLIVVAWGTPYHDLATQLPLLGNVVTIHAVLLWTFAAAMLAGVGLDGLLRALGRLRFRWLVPAAAVALCGWLFADLYSWGHEYNPRVPADKVGVQVPRALAAVPAGRGAPRTIFLGGDSPPALLPMEFRRPEIRGYGQPTRRDYDQFMRALVSKLTERASYTNYSLIGPLPSIAKVTAAANGGYLAYTAFDQGPLDRSSATLFRGRRLLETGTLTVFRNPRALPRAYLASAYTVGPRIDGALAAIAQPSFDPAREIVLDRAPPLASTAPSAPAPGPQPRIASYRNDGVDVDVNASRPALLVLSDSYYPGWGATVDGRSAHVYRANGLFRAVVVPAGRHRVAFRFDPTSIVAGAAISLAALVALIGLALFAGGVGPFRRRRPRTGTVDA